MMVWFMTKSRIFLYSLLAFILGIAVCSFFAMPLILFFAGVIAAAIFIGVGLRRKEKAVILYGFLLIAFLTGVFRYGEVGRAEPDLSLLYGKHLAARGIVDAEPDPSGNFSKLKLKVESIEGQIIPGPFYTQVTLRKYPEYKLGDEIRVEGTFEKPESQNEFDYGSYLARSDIFSVMVFPQVSKIGESQGSRIDLWLSRLKHKFEENIDQVLSEPYSAFLKGLLLGEKSSLPPSLIEDFKITGTSHIVALSGYNITIVGRFFITLLAFAAIPYYLSFWIASLGIILFVLLTGVSASAVRAGIMGILILLAAREGRAYHMTNALAFTAAAMLFQNPRILRFDAPFQLSFLATIGLVYFSPYVAERFGQWWYEIRSRMRKEEVLLKPEYEQDRQVSEKLFDFKKVLVETISAQLAVLPLILFLFGRVSLISPLTNILVLMAVPYAMALGFFTGILGFISQVLASVGGGITWILLYYQLKVIELFAKFPLASVEAGRMVSFFILAIYILIFWRIWKRSRSILK